MSAFWALRFYVAISAAAIFFFLPLSDHHLTVLIPSISSSLLSTTTQSLGFNIQRKEVRELAEIITKDVDVEQFKPGAFNLFYDRFKDAKAAVRKFDGLELDGRPMKFVLEEDALRAKADRNGDRDRGGSRGGREVVLSGGRGREGRDGRDRDNNGKGAPVRVKASNNKSFKDNLKEARKTVEKAKVRQMQHEAYTTTPMSTRPT
jgi:hypothetical protein